MAQDTQLLELLQLFVVEGCEMLDAVEPRLLELNSGQGPAMDDPVGTINSIFRSFHSIKGSAGCLGLHNIGSVTHEAETLLDIFRSGKSEMSANHVDLFLRAIDVLRVLLDTVEQTGTDLGHESNCQDMRSKLVEAIRALNQGVGVQAKEVAPTANVSAPEPAPVVEKPVATVNASLGFQISEEMVMRFVQESHELLDNAERLMLEVEKNPDVLREHVSEIMRAFHSVKGNSGFMGYQDLERLGHKTETVLEGLRDGKVPCTVDNISTLLKVLDMLRGTLDELARGGTGRMPVISGLLDFLDEMLPHAEETKQAPMIGDILIARGDTSQEMVDRALEKQRSPLGQILVDIGAARPEAVEKALRMQEAQRANMPASSIRRDIRVDLGKLDALVNLVGELVIAEAMVTRNPELDGYELPSFERAAHQLRRVASDLQDIAMTVRMIPIASTFQKMMRMVHDLSNKAGKKVRLELFGEETEVDKTVIEQINDPLVHLVRNAIDHGLEPPADRIEQGKPETGILKIEAKHEGGEVWIIITDDGRGLNRQRILNKAIERGLCRTDGSDLSDHEVFKFIFEPGFSTADKVTEVSGRGVGMDVVKKNIERLKGRVDVRSTPGHGSTFVVRIPLTLAIVEGMLVRVGDAQYTIPILAIRESLRPTQDVITVTPDNVEVVRIREELIPVLRLHELFGRKPDIESLYDGILVVVESQEKCVALFADELLGQQQTVIKGLSHFLGTARGISGCTILGDGRVSLIVDVRSLIEMAETRAVESEQIEDDARAATKAANLKNSNRRTGKKTKAKEV